MSKMKKKLLIRGWNFEPKELTTLVEGVTLVKEINEYNLIYKIGTQKLYLEHRGYFGNPLLPHVNVKVRNKTLHDKIYKILFEKKKINDIRITGDVVFKLE